MKTTDEQVLDALRRLVACVSGVGRTKGEWAGAMAEAEAALDRADARPENTIGAIDYCDTCKRWTYHGNDGKCARCEHSAIEPVTEAATVATM